LQVCFLFTDYSGCQALFKLAFDEICVWHNQYLYFLTTVLLEFEIFTCWCE
jgi:hypothetical protein